MNVNVRGSCALVQKTWFSYSSSNGFFWTLALGWLMGPLVFMLMWSTVSSEQPIQGMGSEEFVLYYLMLMMVNQLTYPSSHWTIGESIQMGTLSVWLLRPMSVLSEAIVSDIALKVICFPFVLVVVGILSRWFSAASVPPERWPLFFLLVGLAQVLRFMTAYVLALTALWTQEISALLKINDTLVFLLAGQVVSTTLLPGLLGSASTVLPYRYMLGFPLEYLLGQVQGTQLWYGFFIQIGWIGLAVMGQHFLWKCGIRRYTAVE